MVNHLYTTEELQALQATPKQVRNPRARWSEKPKARCGHRQRTFKATSGEKGEKRFLVYQRVNLRDDQDFSCGIAFLPLGCSWLTLARYNGPSHVHGAINYRPHIHMVSEKAIAAGRKPESEAEETKRYSTPEGALACLIEDFNVVGIVSPHDQPNLF